MRRWANHTTAALVGAAAVVLASQLWLQATGGLLFGFAMYHALKERRHR